MRSALRLPKLLRSERRAGIKHFSGCPDRIAYVSGKQEPEFRHNGIVVVSPAAPPSEISVGEFFTRARALLLAESVQLADDSIDTILGKPKQVAPSTRSRIPDLEK
jgi:hypothetical protein